jgi:glucose-1-phosphate adenylyltransferase
MSQENILVMVMAGGKGERLYPLTLERSKPSVPFGGKYRIIDFVLSNFINSGIYSIYILVQYKSQSLIEHIRTGWKRQGMLSTHFITIVPPQMRREDIKDWYRGTADSIYQNLNLILDFSPKYVAVFGADHIYRMNLKDMLNFHKEKEADVTVASIPIEKEKAKSYGVLIINNEFQIKDFEEKPASPKTMPGKENSSLVSMGNYIFDTQVLIETLNEDAIMKNSMHDFGKDIIPNLIKSKEVYAYDFSKNNLPGLKEYEDKCYWRDVGTIESFYQAHFDLLGEKPALNLSNKEWPIYASNIPSPPAQINNSKIINSLISDGCKITNAIVKNSILGRAVILEKGVEVENSIIMDFTHIKKNTEIKKTIIDRFNTIEENQSIGYNLQEDKKKYLLSPKGIVVIKRGPRQIFYW